MSKSERIRSLNRRLFGRRPPIGDLVDDLEALREAPVAYLAEREVRFPLAVPGLFPVLASLIILLILVDLTSGRLLKMEMMMMMLALVGFFVLRKSWHLELTSEGVELRLPGASTLHPWTRLVAGVEPEAFLGGVRVPLKPGSEGEIVRSGWNAFGTASPARADQLVVMAHFRADSFELAQLILDLAPAMAEELRREAEKQEAPGSDDPEPLVVEGLSSWWKNAEVRFRLGGRAPRPLYARGGRHLDPELAAYLERTAPRPGRLRNHDFLAKAALRLSQTSGVVIGVSGSLWLLPRLTGDQDEESRIRFLDDFVEQIDPGLLALTAAAGLVALGVGLAFNYAAWRLLSSRLREATRETGLKQNSSVPRGISDSRLGR